MSQDTPQFHPCNCTSRDIKPTFPCPRTTLGILHHTESHWSGLTHPNIKQTVGRKLFSYFPPEKHLSQTWTSPTEVKLWEKWNIPFGKGIKHWNLTKFTKWLQQIISPRCAICKRRGLHMQTVTIISTDGEEDEKHRPFPTILLSLAYQLESETSCLLLLDLLKCQKKGGGRDPVFHFIRKMCWLILTYEHPGVVNNRNCTGDWKNATSKGIFIILPQRYIWNQTLDLDSSRFHILVLIICILWFH